MRGLAATQAELHVAGKVCLKRMNRELVLVVQPNTQAQEHTANLLRAQGFFAAGAGSVTEAMEFLRSEPACRMVVSEAALRGDGAFALLDLVAQHHSDVSVILCVSREDVGTAVEAFRRGASDVVLHPLEASSLRAAIEGASLQSQMRRETLGYVRNLEELVSERTGKLREIMADLERSYDVTIEAMGDALDMRDEETEGHSKRVTAYTVAIGRAMKLTASELKTLARGAFLHDIGKIAIPDSILLKPGHLTPDEMTVMQSHCEQGYRIVRKIPFLADAAELVLSHQESFDGTGYPRGLRGEEIPLGARIFAIADTLDAITSDRPYRRGSSFGEALREIERCAGTQFDPAVVTIFLGMNRSTWPTIRAEIGRHSHAHELVRAAAA